jgi:small-conductance mechanosensitive channel/CRP-like cAMP-binding protein
VTHATELVAIGAIVATLAIRGLVVNRLVRSKLRLSIFSFAAYLAFPAVKLFAPGVVQPLESVGHLLLALGFVNLVVVLAVNPWRVDRVPERFPNIVQDALVIGVFLVIATVVMQEKFLTTSAVGAVVIGFALQDTLGNTFAGLALQVEKPFRVGDWIRVASLEGQVREITWRATSLRTKSGDSITVPNNIISKEAILNFSQPEASTRLQVEVGISYDEPPNNVKAVILESLRDAPLVMRTPPPEVVVSEFGASSVNYRVKFYVADYRLDDAARDQVLSRVYYALRRAGIEIPYPIQVEYEKPWEPSPLVSQARREDAIARVDIFAPLGAGAQARLASATVERLFGSAETIVREGEPGESMFAIVRGRVRVTVGDRGNEVATIGPGGYFGEMSLLTGDPRTATVSAIGDCVLLEITADDFRQIALAAPEVVERIGLAVAERRLGLERSRQEVAAAAVVDEAPRSFLARIQQFLRLPLG